MPREISLGVSQGIPFVETVGGEGSPIVVLNGGNAFVSRFNRDRAMRDAARIGRLFPPERRLCILGYEASARERDAEELADAAAALIRERTGRATVAAISFGGLIALRLARRHPDLVERLVLLSTARRFSAEGTDRVEQQIRDLERGDLFAMARPFVTIFRRPWLNGLGALGLFARRRSLSRKMNEPLAIAALLRTALRASASPLSEPLDQPALLVGGTDDQFYDETAMRETLAMLPQGRLALFERETHMLLAERPADVAAEITRFLRE
jgi:pimeloyl-ACP methyl ester carboxylesterase